MYVLLEKKPFMFILNSSSYIMSIKISIFEKFVRIKNHTEVGWVWKRDASHSIG